MSRLRVRLSATVGFIGQHWLAFVHDLFNGLSTMQVNGEGNLAYLQEAQANVTYEQKHACDVLLIGVLSVHVPERVWRDAVRTAVTLATKEKPVSR